MQEIIFLVLILLMISSCATAPLKKENTKVDPKETPQDIKTAVGSIINNVGGKQISSKYCPLCGKHYSASLSVCTKDGATLRNVEE